jgi:DNA uptake protein ComE-like DNA-binding protein
LIIVLWVALGLVTLALYFANSGSLELRAADNSAAAREADQAILGAGRYASNILANFDTQGLMPDTNLYKFAAVPLGPAYFWFIGRGDEEVRTSEPTFGLVDEASKLNLNVATTNMLEMLPGMTPELAAAIVDWRDSDDTITQGGAESDTYLRLNPAYRCKNAPFETIDELRLVYGMNLDLLYGEDANLNGILDSNENDGDVSLPNDNRDSHFDAGFLDYVTVYSAEPATTTNGTRRINVTTATQNQVSNILQSSLSSDRVTAIINNLFPGGGGGPPIGSVLQFYVRSGMTIEEFAEVESNFMGTRTNGLINVNTASETVLACVPGIGLSNATAIVGYRLSNPDRLTSVAWVADALNRDGTAIQRAGPWITSHSYQFTADIAAVGHFGRGYRRVKFVFDTSEGTPRIRYRQDLTHLGWALGRQARQNFLMTKAQ